MPAREYIYFDLPKYYFCKNREQAEDLLLSSD
jgi:hypothetical protein